MTNETGLYKDNTIVLSNVDSNLVASSGFEGNRRYSKGYKTFLARGADILLGSAGLLITSPLMLFIFFLIKLENPGTSLVLRRVRNQFGERSVLAKFRTRHGRSGELTYIGRFLKITGLNWLPLFYQVAIGEQTLFGKTSIFARHRANNIRLSDEEFAYDSYAQLLKYPMDVALVLIASPAILLTVGVLYIIVRRDGGPGFFSQLRVGKGGKEFHCWKIRTMDVNAAEMLEKHLARSPDAAKEWEENRKLADDPRITRIGKILRKSSLDELPQFFNVLKGDMSLVGPRPVPRDELRKYGKYDPYYKAVKPGVTGIWQVSGRNDVSYDERIAMDVKYTQMLNMPSDIAIILKTVTAVLNRTGN